MAKKTELIGHYQLRDRMKQQLPEGSILSTEAVTVMSATLNEIYNKVMAEIKNQPYREFTGLIVSKECDKYLLQRTTLNSVVSAMKNIRDQSDAWVRQLEEKE